MKRKYEGSYFMSDGLKSETVEAAAENVRSDIRKVGGVILNERPAERRNYARPLKKQQAGYYLEIVFEMETDKVSALKERHKLDGNLVRVMIVGEQKRPAPRATAKPAQTEPKPVAADVNA